MVLLESLIIYNPEKNLKIIHSYNMERVRRQRQRVRRQRQRKEKDQNQEKGKYYLY